AKKIDSGLELSALPLPISLLPPVPSMNWVRMRSDLAFSGLFRTERMEGK
ncbi:unnamed protein product, partial [Urochloa humidicola]